VFHFSVVVLMYEDLSPHQLAELENIVEQYVNEFGKMESEIESILETSAVKNVTTLEAHPIDVQQQILVVRDRALSTGYVAISTISNLIQKFRSAPSKLLQIFIRLVNRFVSLLTKYVGLFKIDSIEITISLSPSVVVTLKP